MSDAQNKSLLQQLADGEFTEAADGVEQAKRNSAGMAAMDAKSLLQHYNKSLTTTNQYRIRDFYKASKVRQALLAVNVADDAAEVKTKLLANLEAVKAFYEQYKDDYLSETISHILPKEGTKEFKQLASHLEQSNGTLWTLKANESHERIIELVGSGQLAELEQALSTDKHREQLLRELEALPTGKAYGFSTASEGLTLDSAAPAMQGVYAVSYTHLTLPTSDLV